MGQKANPISLRVQINRDLDTAWYAERSRSSYAQVLLRELQIRKYLQSFYRHLDLACSRVIFQIYPKKVILHSFLMDIKQKKFKGHSTFTKTKDANSRGGHSLSKLVAHSPRNSVLLLKYMAQVQPNSFLREDALYLFARLQSLAGSERQYQLPLDSQLGSGGISESVQVYPQKLQNTYSSARFVADFIARNLEGNLSFREIFRRIQKEVKSSGIRGLRIMCSGRLGGAEMAKVESRKFGQTSLHTFSQEVDFAQAEAYTLYGILGVKVWLVGK